MRETISIADIARDIDLVMHRQLYHFPRSLFISPTFPDDIVLRRTESGHFVLYKHLGRGVYEVEIRLVRSHIKRE